MDVFPLAVSIKPPTLGLLTKKLPAMLRYLKVAPSVYLNGATLSSLQ
jgi:hypothetical protein